MVLDNRLGADILALIVVIDRVVVDGAKYRVVVQLRVQVVIHRDTAATRKINQILIKNMFASNYAVVCVSAYVVFN